MRNKNYNCVMEEKRDTKNIKQKFIETIKEHKVEIVVGTAIGLVHLAYMFSNGMRADIQTVKIEDLKIENILNKTNSQEVIKESTDIYKMCDVEEYIRKLPEGQKPSPSKLDYAKQKGIDLEGDKTIVNGYLKKCA